MCEERCQEDVSPAEIFQAVRQLAATEGHVPRPFRDSVNTVLRDGWLLKASYSDFIEDEREDLGLDSNLHWNSEFGERLKNEFFEGDDV
jgi:heterodisulfide reductase subunit C